MGHSVSELEINDAFCQKIIDFNYGEIPSVNFMVCLTNEFLDGSGNCVHRDDLAVETTIELLKNCGATTLS